SGPRARGARRPAAVTVLRLATGRAPPSGRAPGHLAIARLRAGLGWERDLGWFPGLYLARSRCRVAAGAVSSRNVWRFSTPLLILLLLRPPACGQRWVSCGFSIHLLPYIPLPHM